LALKARNRAEKKNKDDDGGGDDDDDDDDDRIGRSGGVSANTPKMQFYKAISLVHYDYTNCKHFNLLLAEGAPESRNSGKDTPAEALKDHCDDSK